MLFEGRYVGFNIQELHYFLNLNQGTNKPLCEGKSERALPKTVISFRVKKKNHRDDGVLALTFSSTSRFASSSKTCKIPKAPTRVIAAATKSMAGRAPTAAPKSLPGDANPGLTQAQVQSHPAGKNPFLGDNEDDCAQKLAQSSPLAEISNFPQNSLTDSIARFNTPTGNGNANGTRNGALNPKPSTAVPIFPPPPADADAQHLLLFHDDLVNKCGPRNRTTCRSDTKPRCLGTIFKTRGLELMCKDVIIVTSTIVIWCTPPLTPISTGFRSIFPS
jgi:hypothetical protein